MDEHTQATKIAEGQNRPRIKNSGSNRPLLQPDAYIRINAGLKQN